MKLSVWAEQNGISHQTTWNWFTSGRLSVPAIQTATGTILVKENVERSHSTVIYARVSPLDQSADLDRQVTRLSAYAAQNGLLVAKVICANGNCYKTWFAIREKRLCSFFSWMRQFPIFSSTKTSVTPSQSTYRTSL